MKANSNYFDPASPPVASKRLKPAAVTLLRLGRAALAASRFYGLAASAK